MLNRMSNLNDNNGNTITVDMYGKMDNNGNIQFPIPENYTQNDFQAAFKDGSIVSNFFDVIDISSPSPSVSPINTYNTKSGNIVYPTNISKSDQYVYVDAAVRYYDGTINPPAPAVGVTIDPFKPTVINSIRRYKTSVFNDVALNQWYTEYIFKHIIMV